MTKRIQKIEVKNVAVAGISIVADINGITQTADLSNEDALRYKQTNEVDKPIVAMELTCKTFADSLAGYLPGEFMFQVWNSNGRLQKGVQDEIYVTGPDKFLKQKEAEMVFDVHDGFAVSQYEGKEYLMVYPTVDHVKNHPGMAEEVEWCVGQAVRDTDIWPQDILLTFGKLIDAWPL